MLQTTSPVTASPEAPAAPEEPIYVTEELAAVKRKVLDRDPEFRYFEPTSSLMKKGGLLNCLISQNGQPPDPDAAYDRLRWGGQFICVSNSKSDIASLPQKFAQVG